VSISRALGIAFSLEEIEKFDRISLVLSKRALETQVTRTATIKRLIELGTDALMEQMTSEEKAAFMAGKF
jgi:hypothetical protein